MNPEVESDPVMITRTSTDPKALGTSSSPAGRRTGANSGDVAQPGSSPATTATATTTTETTGVLEQGRRGGLSTAQTGPVDARPGADPNS